MHPEMRIGLGRRSFLKAASAISMGFVAPWSCAKTGPSRVAPASSQRAERVVLEALPRGCDDAAILSAARRVAEAATDFSWLSRGDSVLVKPASNSANPYPATTSPLSIRAMVGLLREKGAARVIVADKPGVQAVHQDHRGQRGSSREVLVRNGLQQAALEAGARIHYFDEAGYDAYFGDRPQHESHWRGELMLPDILKQVDHVVLLPRVSRHVLAGTTLGLKAAVGWLRDDSRLELHRDAETFLEKIAEINDAKILRQKLRLIVSVATRVQATFGPDRGYVAEPDPGLVFASQSLLAHDMVALGWLLWNRQHATPTHQLSWYRDPYRSLPSLFNRIFVATIWGLGEFLRSEAYSAPPILSARSDPVIARAAALWGGVPELEMEDIGGRLPAAILRYLNEKALG